MVDVPANAVYLSEDEFGSGTCIVFPNLRSCLGIVVVMIDGSLLGAHDTGGAAEATVLGELKAKIKAHASTIKAVYFLGDMGEHGKTGISIAAKAQTLEVGVVPMKLVDLRSLSRPGNGAPKPVVAMVHSVAADAPVRIAASVDPGGGAYQQTMKAADVPGRDKRLVTSPPGGGFVARDARFFVTASNLPDLALVPQTKIYGVSV